MEWVVTAVWAKVAEVEVAMAVAVTVMAVAAAETGSTRTSQR